ncbi:hypothetical protein F5148DRAFT_1376154 [Russula earlei]|uniref:Uncharacterized protein n=1 Tax=Russula earlei TaxID=71964 RepID=A0ACC0U8F9_9AGAM|nr:hypothetical protein F5148DRAFT_1376154 [Russula earlei]
MHSSLLFALASAWVCAAKTIIITVGGNTTDNGTTTFVPQSVDAVLGDVVLFNFTNGNHTATESTFAAPCIPAHETDPTINGFDSGFRYTQPGTSGTILTVPIINENANHTFWFYDYNTCGSGGVGVINDNESSTETLAGFTLVAFFTFCTLGISPVTGKHLRILPFFQRNAIRLNGTTSSDNTSTSIPTSSPATSSPSASARKSSAGHTFTVGAIGAIPLFIASLFV